MGRLDGRVAIITGAGRGIGAATARLFSREGATVVVNDVDADPAAEVAEGITRAGGIAQLSTHNSVDPQDADDLVQETLEAFGKLDILINNAGITRDRTFHNMTDDLWSFVLDTNLRTAFHCTRAAVGHMREAAKAELAAGGAPAYHRKITFTTSTAALAGNAGQTNYTTAKMALVGLARSLCVELGRFHINVNALAPGFIETRLTAPKERSEDPDLGLPEGIRSLAMMMIPLGYAGAPEDVARAHLFLASEDSDYISGHVLVVGGGIVRS
ncbi:MAG: SDR family NAD(P)-dependent oxidoreductase [Actinomycetota bacterium]